MATPKLNKTNTALAEEYGLEFVDEVPKMEHSRTSKYDGIWNAAKVLCMAHPGRPLKARTYPSSSNAYSDAAKINNGEHRSFKDEDGWTAVRSDNNDPTQEDPFAIYLKYDPPVENEDEE